MTILNVNVSESDRFMLGLALILSAEFCGGISLGFSWGTNYTGASYIIALSLILLINLIGFVLVARPLAKIGKGLPLQQKETL